MGTKNYRGIDFSITNKPTSSYYDSMDPVDAAFLEDAYDRIREGDKTTKKGLLRLKEKYPTNPQISNYLITVCQVNKDYEKAHLLIEEQYKSFPNYLFAKIQYAELCMIRGDDDAFIKVFKGKMNLKDIYPDRDVFHISELASFLSILCRYLAIQGRFDLIRRHRDLLALCDATHPTIEFLDTVIANEDHYMLMHCLKKMVAKEQNDRKRKNNGKGKAGRKSLSSTTSQKTLL